MSVKITYKPTETLTVEFTAGDQKEAFKIWSDYAEILTQKTCGKCKSKNIRPQVRIVEDNHFHEFVCGDCSATLSLGSHKKGSTLFPKRSETVKENGQDVKKWLPDGGWLKWDKKLGKRV